MESLLAGIPGGFQWVFITLAAILSGVGVHTLLSNRQKRKYELQDNIQDNHDKQSIIHETNNANKLEADGNLISILVTRVDKLETKLECLQNAHTSQMEKNAEIKAENQWLKSDNDRMEGEIRKLRDDRRESDVIIAELRSELNALKLVVASNHTVGTSEETPVHVELVNK